MIRHLPLAATALLLMLQPAMAAPAPAIADADTRAWWETTGYLSSDAFEGRDTGSPGHARAAQAVAERFRAAGLKPAGEHGYLQTLPLHEARVESAGTSFEVVRDAGGSVPLRFLHDVSVRTTDALPATLDAALSFRGYCSKAEMGPDMKGRIAVCFGGRRSGVPGAADRLAAAEAAGAVGLIAVDDPGFTIEPARWPDAYARTVNFRDAPPPAAAALAVMRISPDAFRKLIEASGHQPPRLRLRQCAGPLAGDRPEAEGRGGGGLRPPRRLRLWRAGGRRRPL
jgi:hypothetical protein